jgi:Tol biopolymer transport system component
MKNDKLYIIILLFLLSGNSCIKNKNEHKTLDQYFENIPTCKSPELFFPEYFSKDMNIRDITFLPDYSEFYYTHIANDTVIKMSRFVSNKWTEPVTVEFSGNYSDFEPFITPDGKNLFFASKRPSRTKKIIKNDIDIWKVNRIGLKWSEPILLDGTINTSCMEYYPSISQNGNIYFGRNDSAFTRGDIYVSKIIDSTHSKSLKLSETINLPTTSFNAFISPDENYIIFSTYIQEHEHWHSDLFISYLDKNENWQKPVNIGENINSKGNEISPWISYDSRYLFFSSTRLDSSGLNMKYKIFWIKTSAIENFEHYKSTP